MKKGFTLIELLAVIGVSAVLLTVITIPLIQSFNFTRAAQALVEDQERARRLIAEVSGEIANGVGVRDIEGTKGSVAIVVPGQNGSDVSVLLPNSKLDIVMPAQGDPSTYDPARGAFVDPDTGRADPTVKAPRGQIVAPAAPGMTIVRYFIGLRRPLAPNNLDPARYRNPYDGLLMARGGAEENLYVLRRIEFQPYTFDGTDLAVNTELLSDADSDNVPDDLDDPYFFVQDPPGFPILAAPERAAKALRIQNWVAQSQIVNDFNRTDAIVPIFNRQTGEVAYDGNVPRILSLAQFRPSMVPTSPARAQTVLRLGEETDRPESLQADVFRTEKGGWSSAVVRVYPQGYDASSATENHYIVGRYVTVGSEKKLRIFRYDPDSDNDGDDRNGEGSNTADDLEVFDAGEYEQAIADGQAYPVSAAINASESRSSWLASVDARSVFTPFFVDPASGKVYFSFPITQIGDVNTLPGPGNNRPTVDTGEALTPITDTSLAANFYEETTINDKFNKIWKDMEASSLPDLRPDVHRFIDLRIALNGDGTPSPLSPINASSSPSADPAEGFSRAFIVPGSEIVYGPDQNPGPNNGSAIRYTRTTRNPGKNQYKINYVDQQEPNYAALGLSSPPANYDETSFVSAVVQPRFKAGYLQLNSDPNSPLPEGQISVYYKFQLIGPGDTVTVDYDTRESIDIALGIRSYPRGGITNPQVLTLQGSATVRNFLR